MARLTPIRLALLQADRSQRWLSDQIGISETATSRIVNGHLPSDDVIDVICRVLDRPVSVLFPHLGASDHIPVNANATRLERAA